LIFTPFSSKISTSVAFLSTSGERMSIEIAMLDVEVLMRWTRKSRITAFATGDGMGVKTSHMKISRGWPNINCQYLYDLPNPPPKKIARSMSEKTYFQLLFNH